MRKELELLKEAAKEQGFYRFPAGSKQKLAYDLACIALDKKPEPKKAKAEPKAKKPAAVKKKVFKSKKGK